MCISDFFKSRAEAMGPNERLTIDRGWIEWLLEAHACGCGADTAGSVDAPASLEGYSVPELARLFGRGPSTIRTWCSDGVFGDPQTLKPNGRDWRVPHANVVELQTKLAQGYQITSEGLIGPVGRASAPAPSAAQGPVPPNGGSAPSLRQPRPARRKGGRHNEWRQHVP